MAEPGSELPVKELVEGTVYEKNGVKVIAFKVDHHPEIPAFGFRIEYNGHSVVLSGDTRYSKNLISFAKGTDLLVHEVCNAPEIIHTTDAKYNIVAHHVTIEQAAAVFKEVKPRLAAYSHIASPYRTKEDDIMRRTKAVYPGEVVLGEDLMSFTVKDSISVHAWQKAR
jgi:ribonuclease Z